MPSGTPRRTRSLGGYEPGPPPRLRARLWSRSRWPRRPPRRGRPGPGRRGRGGGRESLAFCGVTHARLGAGSQWGGLDADVVRLVVKCVLTPASQRAPRPVPAPAWAADTQHPCAERERDPFFPPKCSHQHHHKHSKCTECSQNFASGCISHLDLERFRHGTRDLLLSLTKCYSCRRTVVS